jgi:3-oxoacyl-[acyl-carrier-protein] synthase III
MAEVAADLMARNGLTPREIDWCRIRPTGGSSSPPRNGPVSDRVMMTIHKYGNTTAATIPLCLWDYESRLKPGDKLLMAAFGGGFTWAGVYLTWSYGGSDTA